MKKHQTISDTFASINEAFKNGEKDNFFKKDNQYICISEYNEKLWKELLENGFTQLHHSEVMTIGDAEIEYKQAEPQAQENKKQCVNAYMFGCWYGYLEPEFPDREGQND